MPAKRKEENGMKRIVDNGYFNLIIITALFILFVEVVFFHSGFIFALLVAGAFIYIGRKRLPRRSGKILFWIGIIGAILNLVNTVAFQFLVIAIFFYYLFHFVKSKKEPVYITPLTESRESLRAQRQLLKNSFISRQRTDETVYEWSDINIQNVWSDVVIDLSYTVLPKGESVIFIRQLAGNVTIFIPYETEISVNHSSMAGAVTIFDHAQSFAPLQNVYMKTPEFDEASQKIKVMISMGVGSLEVKRV